MYAGHLREDVIADDGLVGSHGYAAVAFHHTADGVEFVLNDAGAGVELVLQNNLDARQRRIAAALTQPVDRHVESTCTAIDSGQRVRHRQIVVVVSVEVEVYIGVSLHHLAHVVDDLQGVHDAQRVGQHKTANIVVNKSIHQLEDIRRRVLHAVRPVF